MNKIIYEAALMREKKLMRLRCFVFIYAAHYTCSNVDLNLILVVARTSGFIFQIIDSLMASRGGTLDLT